MKFNINSPVRVRLTNRGREIHRENYKALVKMLAERGGTAPAYVPPVERDGWSTWTMWTLMQQFGPHMAPGWEPPFDTDIELTGGKP